MEHLTKHDIFSTICLFIHLICHLHTAASEDFTITMPGVTTKGEAYVCNYWKPPFNSLRYITSLSIIPDSPYVHHILVYACPGHLDATKYDEQCRVDCKDIYFAWARNAPPTILPEGVAFQLGSAKVSYLRMEVHYRMAVTTPDHTSLLISTTSTPQPYAAAVDLLLLGTFAFPPNTKQIFADMSCQYNNDVDLIPFAFRTHTHTHGKVLTGYVYRDGQWLLIGKSNPQWPQAFWPVQTKGLVIKKGDVLVARAVFSTENQSGSLRIGSTHNDEMCNFYIMHYRNASQPYAPLACWTNAFPKISALLPPYANDLLPPNKTLDDMATMHHPHGDQKNHNQEHEDHHQGHQDRHQQLTTPPIFPVANWPALNGSLKLGELAGLSTDPLGFIYLFHRGSATWTLDTFNKQDLYLLDKNKPIKENTILKVDSQTGAVVRQTGSNFFFMPHGIFIDSGNFIWTTDVALHQVFKFSPDILEGGEMKPLLALGTRFEQGADSSHFCKPSGVVVSVEGDVFVSDGYCNQRVVVFDKSGNFLRQIEIQAPSTSLLPSLPHSISLDEKNKLIYVAARILMAVMVYKSDGTYVKKIQLDEFKLQMFSAKYHAPSGTIFCLDGNNLDPSNKQLSRVFVINPQNSTLISSWDVPNSATPSLFPHDLAVSADGNEVYVALLGRPSRLLKFQGTPENNRLGLQTPIYHRHPLTGGEEVTIPNLRAAIIVLSCLLVIPLVIIVGAFVYLRARLKKKASPYVQLSSRQRKRDVDVREGAKEDELQELNKESEDDDDEEDAFDAAIFSRKSNEHA